MSGRLCLTFDDGLDCQLDHAIPLLDRYSLPGTFFLVSDSAEYPFDAERWKKLNELHEIGSHSKTHPKAAALDSHQGRIELVESKASLEGIFKREIKSYCWPYTDSTEFLEKLAKQCGYRQARGGRAARRSKYLADGSKVNPFRVPCYHVNDGIFPHEEIFALIDAAIYRNAGLVLMFHAIGDPSGWDNVTADSFEELCRFMARRRPSLEVCTFDGLMKNY